MEVEIFNERSCGKLGSQPSKRMATLALGLALVLILISGSGTRSSAQERGSHIRVVVNLVQLNVAVTDKNGTASGEFRHLRGRHS